MRKRLSIIFSLLYLLVMLGPALPYLAFRANQAFITRTYCANLDRPELNCKGHCYFMSKLRQAQPNEEQKAPPVIQYVQEYIAPTHIQIPITPVVRLPHTGAPLPLLPNRQGVPDTPPPQ
jgi:hypothetical protein